ncbi:hypothetical protein WN51_11058 [Melipona quadrifasciata]|uniref:Uncharacterized protein n=1 Tax=Melipona quadrifasciata TaxID=166423 RepID=A0A0M9A645_9HYME|nr:hypothetical protein WN51_11058 [Melipona quadrifasciata]
MALIKKIEKQYVSICPSQHKATSFSTIEFRRGCNAKNKKIYLPRYGRPDFQSALKSRFGFIFVTILSLFLLRRYCCKNQVEDEKMSAMKREPAAEQLTEYKKHSKVKSQSCTDVVVRVANDVARLRNFMHNVSTNASVENLCVRNLE